MNVFLSPDFNNDQTIASFVADVQLRLHLLMESQNVSRTELAERASMSKSRISQIFGQHANITLDTLARLFHALGQNVTVTSPLLDELLSKSESIKGPEAHHLGQLGNDDYAEIELALFKQFQDADLEHFEVLLRSGWDHIPENSPYLPVECESSLDNHYSEENTLGKAA